jgi:hypothetical protein
MKTETIAYKFTKWDINPLVSLKDSKVYQLKEKLINGEEMNREEKNWLFSAIHSNSYSRSGIPLQGWLFDFSKWLKTYYVEFSYGDISKYNSPDKMAIRNELRGIIRIQEVSK